MSHEDRFPVLTQTPSFEGDGIYAQRGKTAEEPEAVLPLPPLAAAGGKGLLEGSPETATPEPPSSAALLLGTEEPPGNTKKKIDILLKAVGDTPIMKTKKWAVERTRSIQGLIGFIKKFLKLTASEQLFIYVNQSFAPSPDQEVGTLCECFSSDGITASHRCGDEPQRETAYYIKGGNGSVACPARLSCDPNLSIKTAIDWTDSGRCDQDDTQTS
ncbi:ubiquitin-like protein ATG12 [Lepus europaeus]|uniref:ubiquitin-like protein ATG12 n=1 Tax=Lepus europaeus TaxID=9983 RepID=UPI002B4A1800|nr:ubiquitin-like protein ATG12 [Lepus europaeus]